MENSNQPYKITLWVFIFYAWKNQAFLLLKCSAYHVAVADESIWLVMDKITVMRGARNEQYKSDKFIEMDEGFFPA